MGVGLKEERATNGLGWDTGVLKNRVGMGGSFGLVGTWKRSDEK